MQLFRQQASGATDVESETMAVLRSPSCQVKELSRSINADKAGGRPVIRQFDMIPKSTRDVNPD